MSEPRVATHVTARNQAPVADRGRRVKVINSSPHDLREPYWCYAVIDYKLTCLWVLYGACVCTTT